MKALPAAIAALRPGFQQKLEGCPAKEIAKLEKARGFPLPSWYREYLELMGRSIGEFRYYQDVDVGPKALLKWYERVKWRSQRYLLFGVSTNDSDFELFVDLDGPGDDCPVVSFEYPYSDEVTEPILPRGTRFTSYLLAAMAARTLRELPAYGRLGAGARPTALLPALRRLLARHDAEEHPLSGTWDKIYVGPRLIAVANELGNEQSLSVSLGCMAVDEWWEIAGRLEHELKLKVAQSPS